MDNQPIKILDEELEKRRQKLIQILDKTQSLERLADFDDWKFFEEWLEKTRERMEKDIIKGSFINDHNGYIYSLASLNTLKMVETAISRFKSVRSKALKDLSNINDELSQKNG